MKNGSGKKVFLTVIEIYSSHYRGVDYDRLHHFNWTPCVLVVIYLDQTGEYFDDRDQDQSHIIVFAGPN